jgi:RNA polymerase sigma-70 factor (ECF subfamily)
MPPMDSDAFADLVEPHRHELRVHCYRMSGSYDEAEDYVQETFLRAWRNIAGFEGRSSVRTWLYRIATNVCLDALDGRARRILPDQLTEGELPGEVLWLQPFPEPDDATIARETVELALLVAIQYLPPRQRAVLILRDALGWSAAQTAGLLNASVASTNSALQRARATVREHLPEQRLDWSPTAEPTERQLAVLRRYMDAVDQGDLGVVAGLLAEDARATMPPYPQWFAGRAAVLAGLTASWDPASPYYIGRMRAVPTRANGRPALAGYTMLDGRTYHAFAVSVFRIADDRVVEITAFHDTHLFRAFGLPMSFSATDRLPGKRH